MVCFVRVRLWLPLLQKVGTIIGGHQVGGRPWVDVCRDWWEAFTAMANVAWKRNFVSGHEQRALGGKASCSRVEQDLVDAHVD